MCGIFGFTITEKSNLTKIDYSKIVCDLFEGIYIQSQKTIKNGMLVLTFQTQI